MKRRLLSLVLALLTVFSLLSVTALADFQDGNVIDLSEPIKKPAPIEQPETKKQDVQTNPQDGVEEAAARVKELGENLTAEDSPLISFSFSSIFDFFSTLIQFAKDLVSNFFTNLAAIRSEAY